MKVPMIYTPRTQPSRQGLDPLRVDVRPGAFGIGLGNDLAGIGAALVDNAERRKQESNVNVAQQIASFQLSESEILDQLNRNSADFAAIDQTYDEGFRQRANALIESLPTNGQKQYALQQITSMYGTNMNAAATAERARNENAINFTLQTQYETARNIVKKDPSQLEAKVDEVTAALSESFGILPSQEIEERTRQYLQGITVSSVEGRIDREGGEAVLSELITGTGKTPGEAALIYRESSGNPRAMNGLGYAGLYQFGAPRLAHIGVYSPGAGENLKTWSKTVRGSADKWTGEFRIPGVPQVKNIQQFLASPEAQHVVWNLHKQKMNEEIAANGFETYIGKRANGVFITREGLQNMLHLGGIGNTRKFLAGQDDANDAFGTKMSDYAKMGAPMGGFTLEFRHANQEAGVSAGLRTALENTMGVIGQSLTITSGHRSKEHNEKVGGAKNSYHVKGEAADIDMTGMSDQERANLVRTLAAQGVGGFITYTNSPNMLHVDMRKNASGKPHFMHDRSSENMGNSPRWFMDVAGEGIAQGQVQGDISTTNNLDAVLTPEQMTGLQNYAEASFAQEVQRRNAMQTAMEQAKTAQTESNYANLQVAVARKQVDLTGIVQALESQQITTEQYRTLRSDYLKQSEDEGDPQLFSQMNVQALQGQLSFSDVMAEKERLSDRELNDLIGTVDQVQRRGGVLARDDVQRARGYLDQLVGGVRGPLATLDTEASTRVASALREFDTMAEDNPDNAWKIADQLAARYSPTATATGFIPPPRFFEGGSVGTVSELKQRAGEAYTRAQGALQSGEIEEEDYNLFLDDMARYLDALSLREEYLNQLNERYNNGGE